MTSQVVSTKMERQPCQIITRVMGYFRPVSHYNIGKKAEFYSRTYFKEPCNDCSQNSQFVEKYSKDSA